MSKALTIKELVDSEKKKVAIEFATWKDDNYRTEEVIKDNGDIYFLYYIYGDIMKPYLDKEPFTIEQLYSIFIEQNK